MLKDQIMINGIVIIETWPFGSIWKDPQIDWTPLSGLNWSAPPLGTECGLVKGEKCLKD